jgi:integrase/recombinase XerC
MLDEALTDPAVTTTPDGTQRSAASLHRFKAAVRSFFAWAEETGLVAENPARSVTLRRLPRTPPVFLTEAEKRRLLKELRDRSSAVVRRDRVIVELFLGTGIRLQELVSLDVDDVDLDAKHLRIRAKGDVPQVKFLKSNLRSLLRRYLAERRRQGTAEPALFLSNRGSRISARQVANRIKFWLAKAGIDKDIGPHGLRHTFATHLYAATSDLLVVKRALGHRDISTTEIYTHLVDGALEEALERL